MSSCNLINNENELSTFELAESHVHSRQVDELPVFEIVKWSISAEKSVARKLHERLDDTRESFLAAEQAQESEDLNLCYGQGGGRTRVVWRVNAGLFVTHVRVKKLNNDVASHCDEI